MGEYGDWPGDYNEETDSEATKRYNRESAESEMGKAAKAVINGWSMPVDPDLAQLLRSLTDRIYDLEQVLGYEIKS